MTQCNGSDTCAILPPDFEMLLREGTPCPLPRDGHTEHRTTTPDGQTWVWDGFECAYPEDCQYDGDGECCVTFGAIAAALPGSYVVYACPVCGCQKSEEQPGCNGSGCSRPHSHPLAQVRMIRVAPADPLPGKL